MGSFVKNYDPKRVNVFFGGVPITGFADGSFISVTPSSQYWTKVSGADGEKARAKSNDNSHEVTITLMQTSQSNDYLSGILALDRASNAGKLPLTIVDLSGTTKMNWLNAWIRQPPDVDESKEITERAWVFDTGDIDIEVYGGNF